MGVDERIFGWLYRRLGTRPEAADSVAAAHLEDLVTRLEIIASAVAERPILVRAAQSFGGIRGATLLLPPVIDLFQEPKLNVAGYLYRVAYTATSSTLRFNTAGLPTFDGAGLLATVIAIKGTRARMASQLPGTVVVLPRLLSQLKTPFPRADGDPEAAALLNAALGYRVDPTMKLAQALLAEPPGDQPSLARFVNEHRRALSPLAVPLAELAAELLPLFGLLRPDWVDQDTPLSGSGDGGAAGAGGTEKDAPDRDDVQVLELAPSNEDENPMVHSFEKVHTADDYKGGSKRHDGEDELDEQLAALDELDLNQVVRTGEPAESVLKLEGLFEGFAGDLGDAEESSRTVHRLYDEWDAKKAHYRKDWCRLYLEASPPLVEEATAEARVAVVRKEHSHQLREMRALLESLELERRWENRQLDGTELDLDGFVDNRGARLTGRAPSDRIYSQRRRREREVATLVLLDLSSSSDAWIDNQRILDVAQDAVIVLGETLHQSRDEFMVAGFQSHTRQDCRWLPIKSARDPWRLGVQRMLSVRPSGYTRIGPAVRHGIEVLAEHPARRRLLLLVTDGKPTDYDRYEGRYGLDDVRQSFREAEQKHVHPFAITITDTTRSTLPRMFGRGNFEVLRSAADLVGAVTEVYARLSR